MSNGLSLKLLGNKNAPPSKHVNFIKSIRLYQVHIIIALVVEADVDSCFFNVLSVFVKWLQYLPSHFMHALHVNLGHNSITEPQSATLVLNGDHK